MDQSGKWVYQQWCAKQDMLVSDTGKPPMDTAATQLVLANLREGFKTQRPFICHSRRNLQCQMEGNVAIIHIEVTLRADQLYDSLRFMCGHPVLRLIGANLKRGPTNVARCSAASGSASAHVMLPDWQWAQPRRNVLVHIQQARLPNASHWCCCNLGFGHQHAPS